MDFGGELLAAIALWVLFVGVQFSHYSVNYRVWVLGDIIDAKLLHKCVFYSILRKFGRCEPCLNGSQNRLVGVAPLW